MNNSKERRYSRKSFLRNIFIGSEVEDWFGWSQPIYSPVTGKVVEASDSWPDKRKVHFLKSIMNIFFHRPKIAHRDIRPFAGNYAIIGCETYYIFIAHMRCDSVKITKGQSVMADQIIGEVGNSGQSLAPHIHFQVMNGPDVLQDEIIPFKVTSFQKFQDNAWSLHKNDMISKRALYKYPDCWKWHSGSIAFTGKSNLRNPIVGPSRCHGCW